MVKSHTNYQGIIRRLFGHDVSQIFEVSLDYQRHVQAPREKEWEGILVVPKKDTSFKTAFRQLVGFSIVQDQTLKTQNQLPMFSKDLTPKKFLTATHSRNRRLFDSGDMEIPT